MKVNMSNMIEGFALVSPKITCVPQEGSGARLGVGRLWGGGFLSVKIKVFQNLEVSKFRNLPKQISDVPSCKVSKIPKVNVMFVDKS